MGSPHAYQHRIEELKVMFPNEVRRRIRIGAVWVIYTVALRQFEIKR
jgi:hypothetical protein